MYEVGGPRVEGVIAASESAGLVWAMRIAPGIAPVADELARSRAQNGPPTLLAHGSPPADTRWWADAAWCDVVLSPISVRFLAGSLQPNRARRTATKTNSLEADSQMLPDVKLCPADQALFPASVHTKGRRGKHWSKSCADTIHNRVHQLELPIAVAVVYWRAHANIPTWLNPAFSRKVAFNARTPWRTGSQSSLRVTHTIFDKPTRTLIFRSAIFLVTLSEDGSPLRAPIRHQHPHSGYTRRTSDNRMGAM